MPAGRLVKVVARNPRSGLNFKQVKQVQRIINKNKQLKHVYISAASTISTTGVLKEFTTVTEGDNFNNRDGDKIGVQSIRFQLSIRNNSTTPTAQDCRIMLVRGKYGPLATGDMPAIAGAPDLDKMQVYYDETFSMSDIEFDMPMQRNFKKKFTTKKIPHLLVNYDDDVSASVAQKNPLYLFYIGTEATNPAAVRGYTYLKFFNLN